MGGWGGTCAKVSTEPVKHTHGSDKYDPTLDNYTYMKLIQLHISIDLAVYGRYVYIFDIWSNNLRSIGQNHNCTSC